jgi:hypothetical protein
MSASLSVRPEVFDAYWRLAFERQQVFFRRLEGHPPPWTEDPIIGQYRFCNAYRASDRVSQYLIREIIYRHQGELSADDQLLRIVLFRLFSKESTWQLLEQQTGRVTVASFDADRYDRVLESAIAARQTIYTSAFILCANSAFGFARKHRNHLALIEMMFGRGRLPREVAGARTFAELYETLAAYPLIGPFMAYQIATDINYSELTDFDEQSFTVAGPGAVRGIRKVFADTAGWADRDIIDWMADRQQQEFNRLGLKFRSLWGRPLQAIDCQNLFCETDKYSRVAFPELLSNRTRIKAKFSPLRRPPAPFYPPKWGLAGPGLAAAP